MSITTASTPFSTSAATLEGVAGHATPAATRSLPFESLARRWGKLADLGDVAVCDEPYQTIVIIHHGEFLDLVFKQYLRSLGQVLLLGGDQIFQKS